MWRNWTCLLKSINKLLLRKVQMQSLTQYQKLGDKGLVGWKSLLGYPHSLLQMFVGFLVKIECLHCRYYLLSDQRQHCGLIFDCMGLSLLFLCLK
jgi:hypothetical protein